ncbi:MAG: hypothetical protein LBB30_04670 [Candidatus Methanoplasma sp.]|jgi:predicted amidohydrolase|nr:hypothetical protein [Candidatus Methanoplasma sp.]
MKDIVLSLAQMRSVAGDVRGNFERMRLLAESVRHCSDIICFPEACLTGYETNDPEPFCISTGDACISDVSGLSKEYGLNIVFGFMEKHGSDLHISQALSDRSGEIRIYRKTHLGRKERKKFIPGNSVPVFELPEGRVGVQLCWESHFPDISTKMRKEGAELILISYASPLPPIRRRDTWMRHLPARAYDNGIFIGAVNAIGDNGAGVVFGGGIMAFDPKGSNIAEHFGREDHVVTVKLRSALIDRLGTDEDMGNTDYFLYRREDLY